MNRDVSSVRVISQKGGAKIKRKKKAESLSCGDMKLYKILIIDTVWARAASKRISVVHEAAPLLFQTAF